ncbi:DUF7737 domain-containing protein [Streptomyces europaeiscabiei]
MEWPLSRGPLPPCLQCHPPGQLLRRVQGLVQLAPAVRRLRGVARTRGLPQWGCGRSTGSHAPCRACASSPSRPSAVGNANGSRNGGGTGNGTPQTGYLPYEGDRMLVVILGKAMLLAKGREITDPTILGQLANCDRGTVTPPTCGSRAGPGRSNNFSRGPSLLQYDGQPIVSFSAAQANNTQESVP